MTNPETLTLVDPTTGNLAFKLVTFDRTTNFDAIQRLNYFTIIWIKNGNGTLKVDFQEHNFNENQMLAFAPYQPFMLANQVPITGTVIHFHPDFFCIHKHQQEVACNGVLFNNIYEPPFVSIDEKTKITFEIILDQIKTEMQNPALAQYELLVSYLKIFLITATRLKKEQQPKTTSFATDSAPFILQNLKNYIETHFKTKHSASDYADLLNITPKSLAKITKNYFNKTLTTLISERIIIEAKRELYLTNKSIKEIAFELGYDDEHYFSRFFKTNADVSPQLYRETVGFAKATN